MTKKSAQAVAIDHYGSGGQQNENSRSSSIIRQLTKVLVVLVKRYLPNPFSLALLLSIIVFGMGKIVIIDYDVHHGNGTQHIFEEDPSVMYISMHQFPFYPGTGHEEEKGQGKGTGTTVNYPLPSGSGDEIYLDIFNNSIVDIVLDFNPELLILSSGFDAHEKDIIGGMRITTEGYYEITKSIVNIAREATDNKILSVLEGGYHLDALAESVVKHLEALSGK